MGDVEKPEGRGRGRYSIRGAEESQEDRLATLEAAVMDLDARVAAFEGATAVPTDDGASEV